MSGTSKRRNNQYGFWGDNVQWSPTDFVPAWVPIPGITDPANATLIPISALPPPSGANNGVNLPGSPGYLPLFLNNDNGQDGPIAYVFELDSSSPLGFTQETYVLREAWDTSPGSDTLSGDGQYYPVGNMAKVNATTRPAQTPRLVTGGSFKEAVILIEDAQSPLPIVLTTGNDLRSGTSGIDGFYGAGGNDSLSGLTGNDLLRGQAGNDTLRGDDGDDVLLGEGGRDSLVGGNDADYLNGGSANDTLSGDAGVDILDGMAGNDSLYGGDGTDALTGGTGNDYLHAGAGASSPWFYQFLFGGAGNDTLVARSSESTQRDVLDGEAGDDFLDSWLGDDRLYGGTGNDTLLAYGGDDTLDGGLGNDLLNGEDNNDHLNGYGDLVNDSSQFDTLLGSAGDDRFILGGYWGVSYVESGDGFAIIADWQPGADLSTGDKIEVKTVTGGFYTLEFKQVIYNGSDLGSTAWDTEIYFNTGTGSRDRIGVIQDSTDVLLGLDFVFV